MLSCYLLAMVGLILWQTYQIVIAVVGLSGKFNIHSRTCFQNSAYPSKTCNCQTNIQLLKRIENESVRPLSSLKVEYTNE